MAQWPTIFPGRIVYHKEGYFLLKFRTRKEVAEVLKGGSYFMNRTPLVVKEWYDDFDLYKDLLKRFIV